ncbi:MAG: flagellar biosynthesis protein FlgC [Alphaproteobacteria bacterium]|nr:flagellar biosynthesis protein FlgC [Alphaproteobacteria bacterium]
MMVGAINIGISGLQAALTRLNASAANIANFSTVGSLNDPDNAPYTPRVTYQTQGNGGVLANTVSRDPAFVPAFDADSPFADENGLIGVPNIDLTSEIVNLKLAELSYKANVQTIEASSNLFEELLDTFDERV